ncbi:MAG: hypothetical protein WBF03_10100 [Xanthobacteraceae bacterium]
MIECHIAGNLNRIALHRASLAQLAPGAGLAEQRSCVLSDLGKQRLLDQIAELEAVNALLAGNLLRRRRVA